MRVDLYKRQWWHRGPVMRAWRAANGLIEAACIVSGVIAFGIAVYHLQDWMTKGAAQ